MSPFVILGIGMATVLGLIIVLRLNAFLALITAAMLVSLLAAGEPAQKIQRVAEAFGASAAKIGIVIALAAVIGECMMESGAADRIVQAFLRLLGQRRAPVALMGSGFVLSVPVFFDTVFYLLVPLARSLYKRTGTNFLLYVLAICAGGAVTHTLVPPTPGPLAMAANLQVDLGLLIVVGAVIGVPMALAGLAAAGLLNRWMPIPLRDYVAGDRPAAHDDANVPSLFASALPVALPVLLISANTIMQLLVKNYPERLAQLDGLLGEGASTLLSQLAATVGDPNLALFLSMVIAMVVLVHRRRLSLAVLARKVETALMSAGVIILITSAGGAFGEMLKLIELGEAIKGEALDLSGQVQTMGLLMLWLGFGVSIMLKVAQGSSTVAMITASGMLAAMGGNSPEELGFNPVYLATAIGSGSLVGSWMNDSGFWIVAKMSGLTEIEALQSWTVLLAVLGLVGGAASLLGAVLLPLV